MKIELWINGYSNPGTKIKTQGIKEELARLQAQEPEKGYELIRTRGLWYIAERGE
jgi:hypothetical protein